MRVLLDTLAAREGGGILYMNRLLDYLRRNGTAHCWTVLANRNHRLNTAGIIHLYGPPLADPFTRSMWLEASIRDICRRTSPQVYLTTSIVPVRLRNDVAVVAQCRNMIPFQNDQRQLLPPRRRYYELLNHHLLGRTFKRAQRIVFVSDRARRIVSGLWPWVRAKSVVIPHGVSLMFEGLVTPPSREDGYLLYVSPLKGYKHQVEVVHALSILRKRTGRHLNLVLIGAGEHSYEQRIRHAVSELRLQESVELTGHLPHDEIPRRFPGALAFVFASSCENCPNTLLEAMASGLPTVCSNVAPMPEFAGDSALYFDPANPQSIADAIMPLMDNPALRVQLSQRAQSKVKDRTWDVSFERLMDVLEEACQSVPET